MPKSFDNSILSCINLFFRFSDQRRYSHTVSLNHPEPAEPWGQGGISLPPNYFFRSVNPIRNRGADYATHISTDPYGFLYLPSALIKLPFSVHSKIIKCLFYTSKRVTFFIAQVKYNVG